MTAPASSESISNEPPCTWNWSHKELQQLGGYDRRLVRRLAIMLEDWAAQPQASIPEGSRSKAAAKASYRLLSNPRLQARDIEQSHRAATWERMARHEWVLAVADTTSFNHTTHPDTEGIGPIGQGNGSAQGFFLHSVLAFSEQGVALGVLYAHTWAREMKAPSRRERLAQKNRKALDQRESHRWTAAYEGIVAQQREAQAHAPAGKLPRLVLVADRESDIYELFVSNITHDSHCAVLVRALHARRLHEEGQIVWEHLEAQPELARIELVVPAQGTRKERRATLALRSARVKLGVPRDKARFFGASEPLELWAIEAVEINAPSGSEPLHWKLLSSIPCADAATVQRQLRWYARRWGIEVFHRTLKSGCQSEARRLGSLEKLERALSLDIIVAWRLMALRDAARQQPEAPASEWLEPAECEVLSAWATRKASASQRTPSIAEAVRWIARLGGYLDRKNDPPPGAQVIWRGLRHLHDMSETWKLAKLVGKS
ncbi:MAG: IS4 family transposase [Verrucomicrobia bacterium]|nr:IS4 family transposase [Verrucomicrobiota bacterium]